MEANEPEKNIPSTAANAITRSPKVACGDKDSCKVISPQGVDHTLTFLELIHCNAQSAFFFIQGTMGRGSVCLNIS